MRTFAFFAIHFSSEIWPRRHLRWKKGQKRRPSGGHGPAYLFYGVVGTWWNHAWSELFVAYLFGGKRFFFDNVLAEYMFL
jgi:hypothetical protein